MKLWVGQFRRRLDLHLGHGLTQSRIGLGEGQRVFQDLQALAVEPVQLANATQPEDFGVFGVGKDQQRLAAMRADTLFRGQFLRFLVSFQMRIIPSFWPRPSRLLAALPLGLLHILQRIMQIVGAVLALLFRLPPEEIILQLPLLGFKLRDGLLQLGDAGGGVRGGSISASPRR